MRTGLVALVCFVTVVGIGCGDGRETEAREWSLQSVDRNEVVVGAVEAFNCRTYERTEVDESPEVVEVRLIYSFEPGRHCGLAARTAAYTVVLGEPLGDRRFEGCDGDVGPGAAVRSCREIVAR